MSELTLGRWIRDRARTTPARVAIDCLGDVTTYAELDARSDRARRRPARRRARAGRPRRDADGDEPGARRRLLRLRQGRTDPDAAEHAARGAGAPLPARGRGAVRAPLLGGVRRARREPARANGAARSLATVCCKVPPRARGRRRPPARLHLGHDREAEGRAADARELLLDEPLLRPRRRAQRRGHGAAGAAAVPRRRLERAAAAGVVEGRDRRARARLRSGSRACS